MIALLTVCLFFCNPCALAESHQQEPAHKLYSATLYLRGHNIEIKKKKGCRFFHATLKQSENLKFHFRMGKKRRGVETWDDSGRDVSQHIFTSKLRDNYARGSSFCISHLFFSFLFVWFKRYIPAFKQLRFLIQPK